MKILSFLATTFWKKTDNYLVRIKTFEELQSILHKPKGDMLFYVVLNDRSIVNSEQKRLQAPYSYDDG